MGSCRLFYSKFDYLHTVDSSSLSEAETWTQNKNSLKPDILQV
jgi:hypothetical protein